MVHARWIAGGPRISKIEITIEIEIPLAETLTTALTQVKVQVEALAPALPEIEAKADALLLSP